MEFKKNGVVYSCYYWDGKRRSYESAPDWVRADVRWSKDGLLFLEYSIPLLVIHPTWIVRATTGAGCHPCPIDQFEATFSRVAG